LPAYRLPSPYDRPPLQRRVSGFALALAINLVLLLILLGLGFVPRPAPRRPGTLTFDLMPESRRASANRTDKTQVQHPRVQSTRPVPKPPPIVLPSKPTITPPPRPSKKPWIEMSKELAAADISNLPAAGAGGEGDSEVVGRGPNGDPLYAAQWAREPSDAEIGGYWPRNVTGWGLVACRTIAEDRVDDCVELDQSPRGSHLASAVRQAAWQFRVRPPRKGGRALIGAWVRILIEMDSPGGDSSGG
jgi:protein TonB